MPLLTVVAGFRGDELQSSRRHRPQVVPSILVLFSIEIPPMLEMTWYRPLLLTLDHITRRPLAAVQQSRLHRFVNRSYPGAFPGVATICLCAACSRRRILLGDSCSFGSAGRSSLADTLPRSLTRLSNLDLSVGVSSPARVEPLSRHEQQRALWSLVLRCWSLSCSTSCLLLDSKSSSAIIRLKRSSVQEMSRG